MGIPKEVTKILEKYNLNPKDFVKALEEIIALASNDK